MRMSNKFWSGKRNGKAATTAMNEVWGEVQVSPPATPKEAEVFCRIQAKRCTVNLVNARDRGDKRAVRHLERKLAVYQFLHNLAKAAPEVTECPRCRVTAVKDGVCVCCGHKPEVEG
jgi:hypothetical protein